MKLIHISVGGPKRMIIDGKGKSWHFEDHPKFGLAVTDRNGDIKDNQPPKSSPFWTAVTHWYQQGKHISTAGVCVWATPPEPKVICVGGKNYVFEGGALAFKHGIRQGADTHVNQCQCAACVPQGDFMHPENVRMIVCAICGNKRCPHATDHRHACTRSNEVGQKGSYYENIKPFLKGGDA